MSIISLILVLIVAAEHVYFLYLEMFAWTAPGTMRAFGTTKDFAEASKSLAANQGLYNGFLAAGLLWGALNPNPDMAHAIRLFFLVCVIVAAVYGAVSVKRSILFVQGGPALLALIAVLLLG